jgi:phage baseplate assembly protein V
MKNKTIRYGIVSSVDPAAHAVRVAFEDEDGMVSDLLPVLVTGSAGNKDYALPDVGDRVICAFLPNGVSSGFVLGAVYSQANLPPNADPDVRSVQFSDGATVAYNRKTHALTISTTGSVNITTAGNVNVTGDVIADGVSLKNHTHGGVEPGGGSTGAPN